MNNGQYKRLIFSIIFAIILLGVTIVLLIAVLDKPKDVVVQYYTGQNGKDGQSIIGQQGMQGLQGVVGVSGKDGVDGTNAQTVIQTNTLNVPIPGPQGSQGDQGPASPQLLVKVDYITCKLLTKYDGDDFWNTLAQLPKPCAIEDGNE